MTAREEAQVHLSMTSGMESAVRSVAWAILDLADAIREGHEAHHMQMYPEENE